MYKILMILLLSITLFADNNQTEIPNWLQTFMENNKTINNNIPIQESLINETTFYLNTNLKKKYSAFITNLYGIAIIVNKEDSKTKEIEFSGESNSTLYVSKKVQRDYPHILEGLQLFKKELNKPKKEKTKFYISEKIKNKYLKLIKLIKQTESMDDDERQYWFDIMPSMTEKQIYRLQDILDAEKKKLEELEVKYQKELNHYGLKVHRFLLD